MGAGLGRIGDGIKGVESQRLRKGSTRELRVSLRGLGGGEGTEGTEGTERASD